MARRVHTLSYAVARKDCARRPRPHQLRDQTAASEIQGALQAAGWGRGETLLHLPATPPPTEPPDELRPVDLSFVDAGDLLLQTTRPPLDDWRYGNQKQVEPAYDELEARSAAVWRRYLDVCARPHVQLTEHVWRELADEHANRADVAFHQRLGAAYKHTYALTGPRKRGPVEGPRTALYLLRVDEAWPGGPGLLGAFGMDGTTTLAWAYRLARDLAHLLDEPSFVVAELHLPDAIPDRPGDLRFFSDWRIDVLARVPVV